MRANPLWMVGGLLLLVYLQSRLWFAAGNYGDVAEAQQELAEIQAANEQQAQLNQEAEDWVRLLDKDLPSIEYQARKELGMVRRGETFYLIADE